jgi:YD repeat-containing protein
VPARPPARLQWAVQLLEVAPDDNVLEIGCGPGVAVALACERLTTGRITAVDRSATAVERTIRRNETHIASGRAVVERCELADLDSRRGPFDKIFAVNVNLFWVRRAESEIDLLRRLLRPDGVLRLFYDLPGGGEHERDGAAAAAAAALEARGLSTTTTYDESGALVCITAGPDGNRSP